MKFINVLRELPPERCINAMSGHIFQSPRFTRHRLEQLQKSRRISSHEAARNLSQYFFETSVERDEVHGVVVE